MDNWTFSARGERRGRIHTHARANGDSGANSKPYRNPSTYTHSGPGGEIPTGRYGLSDGSG